MDIKKTSTVYLICSLLLFFCFPFTGALALYYVTKARNRIAIDEVKAQEFLAKSYKWIIITTTIFFIIYPLLVLFFFILPKI